MRTLAEIIKIAIGRHGTAEAVEAKLAKFRNPPSVATATPRALLAEMTRQIFYSGFYSKTFANARGPL